MKRVQTAKHPLSHPVTTFAGNPTSAPTTDFKKLVRAGIIAAIGFLPLAATSGARAESTPTCQTETMEGTLAQKLAYASATGERCAADDFMKTGKQLMAAGETEVAKSLLEKALALHETRLQLTPHGVMLSPNLAPFLEEVAEAYESSPDFRKDGPLYRDAIRMRERSISSKEWDDAPLEDLIPSIAGLVKLYQKAGAFQEAAYTLTGKLMLTRLHHAPENAKLPIPLSDYIWHRELLLAQKPFERVHIKGHIQPVERILQQLQETQAMIITLRQSQLSLDRSELPPAIQLHGGKVIRPIRHESLAEDYRLYAKGFAGLAVYSSNFAKDTEQAKALFGNAETLQRIAVEILEASPAATPEQLSLAYAELWGHLEGQGKRQDVEALFQKLLKRPGRNPDSQQ